MTTPKPYLCHTTRGIVILFTGLLMSGILCCYHSAHAQFAGGSGTFNDPYLISNVNQLQAITTGSNTAQYKLINDIDASITSTWDGGAGYAPYNGWFNGSLNGDGYTISNLYINRPNATNVGLFSRTGSEFFAKNLHFLDAYIAGKDRTGILSGTSSGTFDNITVTGVVTGRNLVGGLVGQIESGGVITDCHLQMDVTGTGDFTGGIVGYNNASYIQDVVFSGQVSGVNYVSGGAGKNEGIISQVTVSADIDATGHSVGGMAGWNNGSLIGNSGFTGSIEGVNNVGGLVGHNGYGNSVITGCYAHADVTGEDNTGGLIGYCQNGTVELCYTSGTVSGFTRVGGLIGYSRDNATISKCFSISDVIPADGSGNYDHFGGLIGYLQDCEVENCFARGSVTGDAYVGGLIGSTKWSDASVSFCYSTGYVTGSSYTGGLIGDVTSSNIISSYWSDYLSGQSSSAGGIKVPDTTYLMNPSYLLNWDFNNIWGVDSAQEINDGYPYLIPLLGGLMMIWRGTIDTAWENPGNWSQNRIPVINDHIIIPTDAIRIAILSSVASVRKMSIKPAGKLVISHNGHLTVTDLISNSAGTDGLVIASNVSGTGSLIHNNNNVLASFQRYISGTPEAWHLISSPVSDQPFSPEFTPPGTYGDSTGYDLYHWHEPDTSWIYYNMPALWAATHGSLSFKPGAGYLIAFQDTIPTKLFTGTFNNGAVSIPLTLSGINAVEFGFNLVGNPYPSSIDWKASSGWNRGSLIEESGGYNMYIWNDTAMNYGVYHSAMTSDEGSLGTGRYIPPTQGFFVKAAQNGSLALDNNVRVHNRSGDWLRNTKDNSERLALSVTAEDGAGSDQVVLEFGHMLREAGVPKKFSFIPAAPALFLPMPNQDPASIKMLDSKENHPYMPLSFKAGKTGFYTFTARFDKASYEMLIIEDLYTGISHDLLANPDFSFIASKVDPPERFAIRFKEGVFANPHDALPANLYTSQGMLYVDLRLLNPEKNYSLNVFTLAGQMIYRQTMKGGETHVLHLHDLQGVYVVKLMGSEGVLTEKLFW